MDISMDMHGYPWISMCGCMYLGSTMDISMDIPTSFSLNCLITNFEYKLIPLAVQFSPMIKL